MMSILIKNRDMPESCLECTFLNTKHRYCQAMGRKPPDENIVGKRPDWCPLVEIPPHGRLIDADALIDDLKRQCKEVFRVNAVSPDDFWITRNEAYNERLWGTWCESFYGYLQTRPTVIPAEENET